MDQGDAYEKFPLKTRHLVEFFHQVDGRLHVYTKARAYTALPSDSFVVTNLLSGVRPRPCFQVISCIKSSAPSWLRLELLFVRSTHQHWFSTPVKPVFIRRWRWPRDCWKGRLGECKNSRPLSFVPGLFASHCGSLRQKAPHSCDLQGLTRRNCSRRVLCSYSWCGVSYPRTRLWWRCDMAQELYQRSLGEQYRR